MRLETITIKDIAQKLELSTSTVSRALNDGLAGNKTTRKLVRDYAKKLNYSPNAFAKNLKKQRSYLIGVMVEELVGDFSMQLISGVDSVAFDHQYHLIVSQNLKSNERERSNIDHLTSKSVDGLIVALSADSKNIGQLLRLYEKGLPIVFVDCVPGTVKAHKVISNDYNGLLDATEQLIQLGKRKIVYLASEETQPNTKESLGGYKAALHKHNIPFDLRLVKYCGQDLNLDEAFEKVKTEVMDLSPDAIILANEGLTHRFFSYYSKTEAAAGKNLALAGFSNSRMVHLFNPSTTIIRQPAFEMGQAATKLLIELIDAKCPPLCLRTIIINPEVVQCFKGYGI